MGKINWEPAQTRIYWAARMQSDRRKYSEPKEIIENTEITFLLIAFRWLM
jgi:hypothetical protein